MLNLIKILNERQEEKDENLSAFGPVERIYRHYDEEDECIMSQDYYELHLNDLNLLKELTYRLCENGKINIEKIRKFVADDCYDVPFHDCVLIMLCVQEPDELIDFLIDILK